MANHPFLRVVLDSNVLVSLLVFDDPRYRSIIAAWQSRALCVLKDVQCAAEFRRVLAYPRLKLAPGRQAAIYADFDSRTHEVAGGVERPEALPVCADPDDQKFLELAAAAAADCLVTGDKKLLKLAKRVRFAIITADLLEQRLREAE